MRPDGGRVGGRRGLASLLRVALLAAARDRGARGRAGERLLPRPAQDLPQTPPAPPCRRATGTCPSSAARASSSSPSATCSTLGRSGCESASTTGAARPAPLPRRPAASSPPLARRRSSFLLWALRPIAAGAELLFYDGGLEERLFTPRAVNRRGAALLLRLVLPGRGALQLRVRAARLAAV